MVDLKKKTVSASSLVTYLKCGERYRLKYEDEKRPDKYKNMRMLAGTGFHAAIEFALSAAMRGEPVTAEDAVAHGQALVTREFQNSDIAPDDLVMHDPVEELDKCLTRIDRAATYYLTTQFEKLRPLEVESEFTVSIPGTDWFLHGKIDLIEDDGRILDFKLSGSKRTPDIDAANRSEQLSIYALARWLQTGVVPPAVTLEFCRDGGRMGTLTRTSERTIQDCQRTLLRAQRVIQCIESGVYPIASHEGPECNGWCQFWTTCKFGTARIKETT